MSLTSLIKISHFLYFFLGILLLSFASLYKDTGDITVYMLLFTILLIPLFDTAYDMTFGGVNLTHFFQKGKNIFFVILFLFIGVGMYSFGYLNYASFIFIVLAYIIVTKRDSKVFFMSAVILFCYIAFLLLLGQAEIVKELSVYIYYLLIAGVIAQVIESITSPKS